jgi:hypothetical protein
MSLLYYLAFLLLLKSVTSQTESGDTDRFHFLVEGEILKYTSKSKIDRVTLEIVIPFDSSEAKSLVEEYDAYLKSWDSFPAFADKTDITVKNYIALAGAAIENVLKINDLTPRILRFKDKNSKRIAESTCSYSHNTLNVDSIQLQRANIKHNFAQISRTWTLSTILANPEQELALRTFMLHLAETTESLADGLSEVLSTMDSLASNVFPEAARGHYHSAPCIGMLNEEKIIVLDCFNAKTGYICDLEISTPLVIIEGRELLPVHYDNIRLRGDTAEQKFITLSGHSNIQILSCDLYAFNLEDIPACSTFDLKEECEKALQANDIYEIISQCKFTEEIPHPIVQANKGSFLIQGNSELVVSQQVNTEYIPLPSSSPPLVVFSPNTLKITVRDQEWVMSSISKVTALKIVKSLLSQKDIQSLVSKYYYQELWDDMDGEDYVRNLLVVLQVILYPVAILGLAIGIKARKQLFKRVLSINKKPKNYQSNKQAMKSLLK